MMFSPEELEHLQQLHPPVLQLDDKKNTESNTTSKMTAFKKFFSKKADELSEDAARLSETLKEGALEIKQKAVGLKKDSKDEARASETEEDVVTTEDGHSSEEEESEEEDNPVDMSDDTSTTQQSQCSDKNSDVLAVVAEGGTDNDSCRSEDKPEKGSDTRPSLMSALASGLHVAGVVAAGSPQEEDTSLQGTLVDGKTAAVNEVDTIELDEENFKKIAEEEFDDVIVQPKKPVKKKKKKSKGKNTEKFTDSVFIPCHISRAS